MSKRKGTKGQTTIYKIVHRKLKIEQMNPASCYSCYNPGDKSLMRKGPDCEYDKWNIYMIICDTDIRNG
jgi:formate-dependent nitrite reductase cytochrome c552 subunit